MRGRKPTPTVLKVLRGNPGRRPLNPNEPRPQSGVPPCPKHLDEQARQEWDRITAELAAVGLITGLDMAYLAAYCQAYSRVQKLEAKVQRLGECIPELGPDRKATGRFLPNPYYSALNRAYRTMASFGSEFGLSPASRTRLEVDPAGGQDDPLAEFYQSP